ncbi:MAG: thioredoxin domain-containing protein [Phycisphaerales bacterium]
MPKGNRKNRPSNPAARRTSSANKPAGASSPPTRPTAPVEHPAPSPHSFIIGLIGVGAALVFSILLSVQSIAGTTLPGCGPKSACAAATSSAFGKLPLIGWPVSHLGTAYFLATLCLWITTLKRMPGSITWLIRAGAAVSAFYIVVILTNPDYACPYCLAAHAGNFILLIAAEWRRIAARAQPTDPKATPKLAGLWGAGFVAATLALVIASGVVQRNFESDQEEERLASTEQLTQRIAEQAEQARQRNEASNTANTTSTDPDATPNTAPGTDPDAESPTNNTTTNNNTNPAPAPPTIAFRGSSYGPDNPFVGRYIKGPDEAPVRIVVFSGFQCPDCKTIDADIMRMFEQYPGQIAYSHKQFPFNIECNPYTPRTLHDNACWAARVAEIAGMIGGDEAFYKMHDWLYEVDGRFISTQDLQKGVAAAGLQWSDFSAILNDPQQMEIVNQRIAEDVDEGVALGLSLTPMVFINGVEMRGIRARNAIANTVAAAIRADPPALGFDADTPIPATERAIELFLEDMPQQIPASAHQFASGPLVPNIDIQIWGSHAREDFREALAQIQSVAERRGDISITLRHYPLDPACNPHMSGGPPNDECEIARLLDAVGIVAGAEAHWRLADWLMANAERYTLETALAHLRSSDIDTDAVIEAMNQPQRTADIQRDIQTLRSNMRMPGVPAIFINGRHATNWRGGQREPILDALIEAAANAGPMPPR